jgi:peptide/nickel transport system substrate-binding protein
VAANATTEDFNSGKAAIGSGRYKLAKYTSGDRVELVRNDTYWGDKSPWEKVTFKIIKNEPARVAALLSGDVDAIEQPPTADLSRIKGDPKFTVSSKISHRVIYFNFDHLDRSSPFITDKAGKPLAKNPLLDVRVRRAISKAINRQAIVDRVMEGQAIPSGQLVSEKLFGNVPGLKADAYDVEGAKKLLAEAGYPDGFNITIHGPAGRYVNDEKIVQAVAQMLSRVGITAKVETAPMAPYSARAAKQEFSLHMVGWGRIHGRSVEPAALAARDVQSREGIGRRQLGSLQQRQGRLPDRAGAAAGRRREPQDDAAERDQARDGGSGNHAGPLPVHDLGDQEERHVHAAHRRVHARVPVQAGRRRAEALIAR